MRRLASALFIASLMLALLPGAASAAPGDLDQSSTSGMTGMRSDIRPAGTRWLGQTFTAGMTGLLTHIELYLFLEDAGVGESATITIDIWPTTSGLPSGSSPLATTSAAFSSLEPQWADFVFAAPPQLTAGTMYAMVVTGSPDGYVSWYYTDSYPGGQTMWRSTGGWNVIASADRAFRTYVFRGPTLQWSAPSMVAGTSATLTLTETFTFPAGSTGSLYIEQVALPAWFTVTGTSCSSQIGVTCDAASFLAGSTLPVTPDGNPIVVTLTGTAAPPAGAAGSTGTATGQTCVDPSEDPICSTASGQISILAPGATPPPSGTEGGDSGGSDMIPWLLPAVLGGLLGAMIVSMRRAQFVR